MTGSDLGMYRGTGYGRALEQPYVALERGGNALAVAVRVACGQPTCQRRACTRGASAGRQAGSASVWGR